MKLAAFFAEALLPLGIFGALAVLLFWATKTFATLPSCSIGGSLHFGFICEYAIAKRLVVGAAAVEAVCASHLHDVMEMSDTDTWMDARTTGDPYVLKLIS